MEFTYNPMRRNKNGNNKYAINQHVYFFLFFNSVNEIHSWACPCTDAGNNLSLWVITGKC